MNIPMLATVVLVVILLVSGGGAFGWAWWGAGHSKHEVANRAQVLGALAAGLLTGAAVALGVVLLQQWQTNSSADALWRASVETAANIPGFSPGDHSLGGIDLSGKQLEDANLSSADLRQVELRDTDLARAVLTGADLRGVKMYSANFDNTVLTGADFSHALLMGAQFVGADFRNIKSFAGAQADAFTCWPPGFLESPLAKGIIPKSHGSYPASPGQEFPHCLPYER